MEQASRSNPSFRHGQTKCEGVRLLQRALLALCDPNINIPAGATGNYLDETKCAVIEFQRKYGLMTDGIAGRRTVSRLDQELRQSSQRVLATLDRALDQMKQNYESDEAGAQFMRDLQLEVARMRHSNLAGLALTWPVVVLLAILLMAFLYWLSLPSTQKALRQVMRELIDAVKGRGEVAQEKIDELKKKINEFIDQARDIRTDCENEVARTNPEKLAECQRKHGGNRKSAFDALIRVMKNVSLIIFDSLGRGKLKIPRPQAVQQLRQALQDFVDALNDFLKCLDCPEVPTPDIFPDDLPLP
jgi:hypothetical protein